MSNVLVSAATIQLKDLGGGVYGSVPASSFIDGQPFTISGAGFGVKASPTPEIWDKFDSYNVDSLLQVANPSWEEYNVQGGAIIKDNLPRYSGARHAYNDSTRSEFGTNTRTYAPTDEVYMSYWFATEGAQYEGGLDPTDWIGKLCRITSSGASGGGGVYNGLGQHSLNNFRPKFGGTPYVSLTNGNNQPVDSNFQYYMNYPDGNDWVRIDMYAKLSDLDVANGVIEAKMWGADEYINNSTQSVTSAGGVYLLDSTFLGLAIPSASGTLPAGVKLCDFYLDIGSQAKMRVELTNNSNYSLSTHGEVQPATAWADGEITITANAGSLPSGTYYIHVLDSSGSSIFSESVTI